MTHDRPLDLRRRIPHRELEEETIELRLRQRVRSLRLHRVLRRDDQERFGGDVDMIMAFILADPSDPAEEEANIAAMAARFAGQPEPAPV